VRTANRERGGVLVRGRADTDRTGERQRVLAEHEDAARVREVVR